MTVRIKICGVTRADDAQAVAHAGADLIGLNFWPRSKRAIDVATGRTLAEIAHFSGAVDVVGLFVDAALDDIVRVAAEVDLDVVQLHGDEPPGFCTEVAARTGLPVWKAVPVGADLDVAAIAGWPVDAVVLDAPSAGRGGSGQTVDWTIAAAIARGELPVALAGGLTPDNVADAIRAVRPWAVDVASGVERAPGVKDAARVIRFVEAARAAATSLEPSHE